MRNLSDHDGLEGDKSSKSGSGSSTANTIKSSARVRVVDVLSEGPIQGLVNGAKSIYINDVALQNADGTYNFEDVT